MFLGPSRAPRSSNDTGRSSHANGAAEQALMLGLRTPEAVLYCRVALRKAKRSGRLFPRPPDTPRHFALDCESYPGACPTRQSPHLDLGQNARFIVIYAHRHGFRSLIENPRACCL